MEAKAPEGVFPSTRDRFRGITVDTDRTTIDAVKFPEQLTSNNIYQEYPVKLPELLKNFFVLESLKWWSQQDSRAIWFKINLKSTALVPILAEVNNYYNDNV